MVTDVVRVTHAQETYENREILNNPVLILLLAMLVMF